VIKQHYRGGVFIQQDQCQERSGGEGGEKGGRKRRRKRREEKEDHEEEDTSEMRQQSKGHMKTERMQTAASQREVSGKKTLPTFQLGLLPYRPVGHTFLTLIPAPTL